jgi:cysteine desulfuration protein SufE
MDMQTVIEAFQLLDTWEERFEYVTDLGRKLAPFPDAERTDTNLVAGCDTRTWLIGRLGTGEPPVLELISDAETPLVRGLVAVLLLPFRGKTSEEVLGTDPRPFFDQLHLESALSAKRRAGMEAFLDRIRRIAAQHGATV